MITRSRHFRKGECVNYDEDGKPRDPKEREELIAKDKQERSQKEPGRKKSCGKRRKGKEISPAKAKDKQQKGQKGYTFLEKVSF